MNSDDSVVAKVIAIFMVVSAYFRVRFLDSRREKLSLGLVQLEE